MSIFDPAERDNNNLVNPLRQSNPEMHQWAQANGWNWNPHGNEYFKNVGGQVTYLDPEKLAHAYQSQQYLQQASALPTQSPNYLAQIQQYLQPQQQQLSSLGASAGTYTNPYEERLQSLMNNPDSIANSNAYKFRFNQGQQALESSAAARGMLGSGNTLAALANYGQGAASQEYGNEFERLSSAVGQRNQFNLGRMQTANQELGLRQQDYQSQAGTALKALTSADDYLLNQRKTGIDAASRGGLIKPGAPTALNSTW